MTDQDRDQDLVAAALGSAPPPEVSPAFLARVNARIDEEAGWLGLLDFRAWTLRLAPIAAAIAVLLVLWPGAQIDSTPASTATPTDAAQSFTPASESDWQQDVTPNAILEAALTGKSNDR